MMIKNKIWLLLDSRNGGGIESHVLQLAEGLQQHGEQVEVIFLTDYGPHPMRNALTNQGIKNRVLNGKFTKLYSTLKADRPNLLHTHGYKAGIFGRLATWLINIPSISTYHAGEVPTGKLAFYDWLDRVTAGFSNKNFAVSPQIAKRLPGNIDVFNNFVNSSKLNDSAGVQIAFVGRASIEKGPDYFMELAAYFPNIDFHLYGEGPLLAELKATAPKNLKLHGQQNDMSKVWSKIGLLVMPSRFEGLPMSALEAMARAIPVLAFNVGALDRLIQPGVNGWLIEPNNIDQLSLHIEKWNNLNQKQKSALQLASKNIIKEKFSSDVAIPKLVETYRKIAHESH